MNWDYFIYFAIVSVLCWAIGAYAAWKDKTKTAYAFTGFGLLVFFAFICWMEKDLVKGVIHLVHSKILKKKKI